MTDESFCRSFVRVLCSNPFFSIQHFEPFTVLVFFVAYFFATSTNAPWWGTALIFIASMIFSRILFKLIQSKFGGQQSPSE